MIGRGAKGTLIVYSHYDKDMIEAELRFFEVINVLFLMLKCLNVAICPTPGLWPDVRVKAATEHGRRWSEAFKASDDAPNSPSIR